MKKKEVTVSYDDLNDSWTAENPVRVERGITTIVWKVRLSNESTGQIRFGTRPDFQGIVFDPGWPGTRPEGDAEMWFTTIRDTLGPNDPPRDYHYTVNAIYRGNRAEVAQEVSWDPDVEEDPGN